MMIGAYCHVKYSVTVRSFTFSNFFKPPFSSPSTLFRDFWHKYSCTPASASARMTRMEIHHELIVRGRHVGIWGSVFMLISVDEQLYERVTFWKEVAGLRVASDEPSFSR